MNEPDHIGIEIINVKPDLLLQIVSSLKKHGFNYLQCQGGYDEGPGKKIVCFYHLISIKEYKPGKVLPSKNIENSLLRFKQEFQKLIK